MDPKPEARNATPLEQPGVSFRFMREGEEGVVCDLVNRIFDLSVAPLFSKKGRKNFKKYADPEKMSARVHAHHFVFLAMADGDMIGMIEMRRHGHISLFFIEQEFQGKGIGRELLGKVLALCCRAKPRMREMTVNSSPNARRAYERLGFTSTGREQNINGVQSVPMVKVLD